MSDLQTLVAQEVAKQLAAIAADQTTKKVLEFLKNRNSADAYVVETGGDSTSWYRVWSDGLLEQGGSYTAVTGTNTVTFLKPFSNADYFIGNNRAASDSGSVSVRGAMYFNKTPTSAETVANAGNPMAWYAVGF